MTLPTEAETALADHGVVPRNDMPDPTPEDMPFYGYQGQAAMQPLAKQRWLDALRSGKFLQTTGSMKLWEGPTEPVRYCCLGVLREVCKTTGADGGYLTEAELAEFGIEADTMYRLARMNDSSINTGVGFPEIAAWIEENL